MKYAVHLCRFDSADHLRGKARTYETVKAAVLKAGRFSVFEASSSPKNARLFERLERDPDLKIDRSLGFPWIGVRKKR